MVASPPIAALALMFGPAELAMLILFALVVVAGTGAKSQIKGLISTAWACFWPRWGWTPSPPSNASPSAPSTWTRASAFWPCSSAFWSCPRCLVQMEEGWQEAHAEVQVVKSDDPNASRVTWPELKGCLGTIFRSSLLGSFCGALPGVGSITAAFMGYDQARRLSKHPERFGKGEIAGQWPPRGGQQRGVRGGPHPPGDPGHTRRPFRRGDHGRLHDPRPGSGPHAHGGASGDDLRPVHAA